MVISFALLDRGLWEVWIVPCKVQSSGKLCRGRGISAGTKGIQVVRGKEGRRSKLVRRASNRESFQKLDDRLCKGVKVAGLLR